MFGEHHFGCWDGVHFKGKSRSMKTIKRLLQLPRGEVKVALPRKVNGQAGEKCRWNSGYL